MDFASMMRTAAKALKPRRVVQIPPTAWAEGHPEAPVTAVDVGLKLLSEQDVQEAKVTAARVIAELYGQVDDEESIVSGYNDALMRACVGRATCKPDSAATPFFELGEDEIRVKLTPEGIRGLYQEIEANHLALSPTLLEIDEDGRLELAAMLQRLDLWDFIPAEERPLLGRLLAHCHGVMQEAEDIADDAGVPAVLLS